ncbi:alcohol dehydrogenase catalytic domain-containing protein [Streptosporangium sp. NPDC020072]|uniref:alcohol dehydrogenase catalytic domain-containing protein n=1 Tax=Streptosporangium sp. NPDC020072 TaxID=3154788 RepID=UPI003446D2D7
MRAAVLAAPGDVRCVQVADPTLKSPHEAIVRVVAAGICGSDLWAFNGIAVRPAMQPIGHEFVGEVVALGTAVDTLQVGDEVAAPFSWNCGECVNCANGWTSSCQNGGFFGRSAGASGAQSEYVRVPHANGTLVVLPKGTLRSRTNTLNMLLCGDVLATGQHAVELADVRKEDRCVIIGDGSVGLAAAAMAKRAGASHVTLVGHHTDRISLSVDADLMINARTEASWDEEVRRGRPDAVLDCVGTARSTEIAVSLATDGGRVGVVGVPHGVRTAPVADLFRRNIALRFGITPARRYLTDLLSLVLGGGLDASWLITHEMNLMDVADGYRAMAERRSLKIALRPYEQ